MKTQHNLSPVSTPSPKPRQLRTREPSLRFLHSPTDSPECHSPLRRKSSSPADGRRQKITTEDSGLTRHQLWPSSSATAKTIPDNNTLADHLTEDRIIDNTKSNNANSDSNSKSSVSQSRNSFSITNLESEYRESGFPSPRMLQKPATMMRSGRRGASDSNIVANLNGNGDEDSDSSVFKNKLLLKKAIKRVNSLTGYKSSKSQWALSPGRSESKVSNLNRSTSPSPNKAKGVEKILNLGLDLFKSKKSLDNSLPAVGFGNLSEDFHQLRLLHNRFIQWRFANARARVVNRNISLQAESNLVCAWDSLTKLQHSVIRKKIQFVKEKLQMKITFVLYSQMKLLETWGGMERQHASAITATIKYLHSVVCKVPLQEGAKVNIRSISIALQYACDLTASIKTILTKFSPLQVDTTATILSELAKVVAQEKQLLEEFYDLFKTISLFEVEERSVKCNLVQLEGWQQKYQLQKLLPEIITS